MSDCDHESIPGTEIRMLLLFADSHVTVDETENIYFVKRPFDKKTDSFNYVNSVHVAILFFIGILMYLS